MSDAQSDALRRRRVVRTLVAASLALLVAGAVAPLLTTERFYFFSNTFSLASGLRQLAAQREFLVLSVIFLFSLCVPTGKGIVIWLAASGQTVSRSLLVLADRFGKWSMLEVFVAALLITALKLGPVVDVTLHYGAYLLAASVLLSGIASQLLPHEHDRGPVFSSPMTLTIGAVVGAVAATSLLGLLNPRALTFDAWMGTPESRCIVRVLELERLQAQASATHAEYAASLSSIDMQACPETFRDAFEEYVVAWTELDAQSDTGRGWIERVGTRMGLLPSRDDSLRDIEEAWAAIERAAREHGVEAAAK
jgi:paraquat-inducible protein A